MNSQALRKDTSAEGEIISSQRQSAALALPADDPERDEKSALP